MKVRCLLIMLLVLISIGCPMPESSDNLQVVIGRIDTVKQDSYKDSSEYPFLIYNDIPRTVIVFYDRKTKWFKGHHKGFERGKKYRIEFTKKAGIIKAEIIK